MAPSQPPMPGPLTTDNRAPTPLGEGRATADARTRWLPWLRWWADLLDSRFRVPGTNVRFGLDPVLSLLPGLGDLASPMFTAALLAQVLRQRIPRIVVLRMLANALVDAVLGAIPIAGTVGDVFFRANQRNLALLERHADPTTRPDRSDYAFVLGMAAVFGVVLALPVLLAIWLAIVLWRAW